MFLSEKAKRLTPYVAGLQPKEDGWIKLNTNENPYPPSPKMKDALNAADFSRLRLYPDTNSGFLCAAIADVLGVEKENVFCGNSSDEVLALAFQAFYSGKDNVISPDISYGYYPVWGYMYDVGFKFAPLRNDFSIDINDYKNANGVVIANPNAPTSLALGLFEIEEILKNNPTGVVIIDEAYINYAREKSAVSLVKKYENLLVVNTFSKSHSLAGLRVGFAVGQPTLIDGLRLVLNAFNSYPLDMLAQTAAAAAFSDVAYTNEISQKIIDTREKTINELKKMNINVLDSQANFIFVENDNSGELYEFLFENKILVRHWKKPRISNYLRVSIGTEAEMDAFLKYVGEFVGRNKNA